MTNCPHCERYRAALETIDDDPPMGLDWHWHRSVAREALTPSPEEREASSTPHPDTVRLEKLAEHAASDASIGWYLECDFDGGLDDLRSYIDGLEP